MAASDPVPSVPTPTGALQGVAAFSWDGAHWQPSASAGPDVATPTGVLRGVAPFSYSGGVWTPTGSAGPDVATPTGTLDGVAVYTWSGSAWTPAPGGPDTATPTGVLQGIAAFYFDGTNWQPTGQAGPDVATPTGVLQGVAMFAWSGSAWAASAGIPPGVALDANFMVPGTLPAGVTPSRGSTATYFDATGTMQTVSGNTPRWDYNPSTLVLNGLLIEEARTNLSVTVGSYTGSSVTFTPNAGTAPDGTNTMVRIAPTSATAPHYILINTYTFVASTTYAFSVFAGAQQYQYMQLFIDDGTNGGFATFDLLGGTITGPLTARGTGVLGTATMTAMGNNVYRCSITVACPGTAGRAGVCLSTTANPAFAPSFAGNTANGFLVWGAQTEQGTFATSYIPTTGAAVTRNGDFYDITPIPWFVAGNGTMQAEFMSYNYATAGGGALRLDDSTASNSEAIALASSTPYNVGAAQAVAGTANGAVAPINISFGTINKAAYAWQPSGNTFAANGVGEAAAAATALPTGLNRLRIGNNGTGVARVLNGYMRRARYWPRALSNTELQQVTT